MLVKALCLQIFLQAFGSRFFCYSRTLKLDFERKQLAQKANEGNADIPSTDIDQLARSMDEEALERNGTKRTEQLSEALLQQKDRTIYNTDLVESWLDSDAKPSVNGHQIKTVCDGPTGELLQVHYNCAD